MFNGIFRVIKLNRTDRPVTSLSPSSPTAISLTFERDVLARAIAEVWVKALSIGEVDHLNAEAIDQLDRADSLGLSEWRWGSEAAHDGSRSPHKASAPRGALELNSAMMEGKMLGVLIGRDREGSWVFLRAFSGQLGGRWRYPGWAPPLFDLREFAEESWRTQAQLHLLTRGLNTPQRSEGRPLEEVNALEQAMKRARKSISRRLTQRIHESYRLVNLSGEVRSLASLWPSAPTGTGDCCAPKLICWASRLGITPLGLTEFWWGSETEGHRRGAISLPCSTRCQPILPFLLG
jgi:hypothetical protein